MKIRKPNIHSGSSKLLRRTLLQVKRETGVWNMREVARRLNVNPKYVHDNLIYGIIPTNDKIREAIGAKKPKPPRVLIDCPRCGKSVFATKTGRPKAHDRPDGIYCEDHPTPIWRKRWLSFRKPMRDAYIEELMTANFAEFRKWAKDAGYNL